MTTQSSGTSPSASKATGEIVPTKIYINQVPEYNLLATCAEPEVSSIVRNMVYGCGDGSRLTSYACFCYESSPHFGSLIGSHVATACKDEPAQSVSAMDVFNQYCQIGATKGFPQATAAITTSTFSNTVKASRSSFSMTVLVSGISTTSATSSPAPTATSAPPPTTANTSSRTTAISVGVSVSIVFVLAIGALFLYRKRKQSKQNATVVESGAVTVWEIQGKDITEGFRSLESGTIPAELASREKGLHGVTEVSGVYHPVELPTDEKAHHN